jgi:retinol-binding protein 3
MTCKHLAFAIICFLPSISAISQNNTKLDKPDRFAVVDSFYNALINYYVFPEKGKRMGDNLKNQLVKGAFDTITNPDKFANALVRAIRSVHPDQHISLRYDPQLEKSIRDFNKPPQPDRADLQKEREQNFFFRKAEILPGNIGYILFTNFADTNELSRKTVRAALQFVANSNALIIDLRNNFGGRMTIASEILGYFYNKPTLTGRGYNRLSNTWTETWVENKQEITGGLMLNMPVYLLTSERTFSAAEGLAYNLQQIKKATVVGDTTRGGAHLSRSFALGNGFVAFIPYSRGENIVTKTDWEGTGVIPSIPVDESNALIKAQELILQERLINVKENIDKQKIEWLLNDLKAKTTTLVIPLSLLQQYTGEFEEFSFIIKDNQLFCVNTHNKNKIDKLIPISETLFKIDVQSQVEFVKDSTGKFSSIKLLWDDGWADVIRKTK